MKPPHDPAVAAGSIGQQNAAATLKAILRTYPWQLTGTFSLVALENALLLAYPLFAGFAVDAIIRGNVGHAISYAGVVLLFWLVGCEEALMFPIEGAGELARDFTLLPALASTLVLELCDK